MTLNISFVIRTYGDEHIVKILSLLEQQEVCGFNINEIVIVNGKDNYQVSKNKWKSCYPIVITSINEHIYKPGKALNNGIKLTTGYIIVFLSGHSVPCNSKWLMTLISPFSNLSVAGICGGQLYYTQSNIIEKGFRKLWYQSDKVAKIFRHFNFANAAIKKCYWEAWPINEEIDNCEDRLWSSYIKYTYDKSFVFRKDASVYHSHMCSKLDSIKYIIKLWLTSVRCLILKEYNYGHIKQKSSRRISSLWSRKRSDRIC
jgi:Glycosyl transferase family 2